MVPSEQKSNNSKTNNMSEYIVNQALDGHANSNTVNGHLQDNSQETDYKKPKSNFSMADLNIDNNFDNSKKLSLNSSTHTQDTVYNSNGSNYPYDNGSMGLQDSGRKRMSLSQSPKSNVSSGLKSDGNLYSEQSAHRIYDIDSRVVNLENTVNKLLDIVNQSNDILKNNLGNKNYDGNIGTPNNSDQKQLKTTQELLYKQIVDPSIDQNAYNEDSISPITTTVKNPITQEPKLFKLDPKKINKKRNRSKSNSAKSSSTKLSALNKADEMNSLQLNSQDFNEPNSNFNGFNRNSFNANTAFNDIDMRKRNSSIDLPLPLSSFSSDFLNPNNPNGNSISIPANAYNSNGMPNYLGAGHVGKMSYPQLQPLVIPPHNDSIPMMYGDQDYGRQSSGMQNMVNGYGYPGYSPKGMPPSGSVDSLSSARTSFDEKQLQMYHQLQQLSQKQNQINKQFSDRLQTPMHPPNSSKMEFLTGNGQFPSELMRTASDTNSAGYKNRLNSISELQNISEDVPDSQRSNDSITDMRKVSTPDVTSLLGNKGRLKPVTSSKKNPKPIPKQQYEISRAPSNIQQVWQEYRYGIDGHPALILLDKKYGNAWLEKKSKKTYSRRKVIYEYIIRGISQGMDENLLISNLEDLRVYEDESGKTLKKGVGWIQDKIINVNAALGYEKLDELINSGEIKPLIYDDARLKLLMEQNHHKGEAHADE